MKKTIFILSVILLIVGMNACKSNKTVKDSPMVAQTVHNSRNSLDWDGTYSGVIPCADCPGIETQITLLSNNTFKMTTKYIDRNDTGSDYTGEIQWDKNGGSITLKGLDEKDFATQYKVGENALFQLDKEGNVITGNLASNYILTKVDMNVVEKYWKLFEIFGANLKDLPPMATDAYFTLKIEGNRVIGSGGCNNFTGAYQLLPGMRIKFSQMVSTSKMCITNMEVEQKLNQALGMADSYFVKGDTLILNRARMAPLARFEVVYLR